MASCKNCNRSGLLTQKKVLSVLDTDEFMTVKQIRDELYANYPEIEEEFGCDLNKKEKYSKQHEKNYIAWVESGAKDADQKHNDALMTYSEFVASRKSEFSDSEYKDYGDYLRDNQQHSMKKLNEYGRRSEDVLCRRIWGDLKRMEEKGLVEIKRNPTRARATDVGGFN